MPDIKLLLAESHGRACIVLPGPDGQPNRTTLAGRPSSVAPGRMKVALIAPVVADGKTHWIKYDEWRLEMN